jgi:hypothetical protein
MESAKTASGGQAAAMAGAAAIDHTSAVKDQPEAAVVLLAELPRGHDLRTCPLGEVGAECRNKQGKEWRNVTRWRIAANSYDDLGPSWTDTSEFRVRAVPRTQVPGGSPRSEEGGNGS